MYIKEILPQSGWLAARVVRDLVWEESGESIRGYDQARHFDPSGETLRSCTMIITEPNKFVAEVHDRMPVLLAEEGFEPWLSGNAGVELF
jgi:putative SOS response-associated peptidase YedK